MAHAWARTVLKDGDAIVLTPMEHHSNLVPWHLLAAERKIELRFIPMTADGQLDVGALPGLLADGRVKLVSFVHVSNVLGTVNPAAEIARIAKAHGATVLVDASQSAAHMPLDVRALGADFVAFTGHKMLGPTGIGVLWGRRELLEAMPPFLGGGEMIREVSLTASKWNELPWKFEAGTMAIAEAVGLGAAIAYLRGLGMDNVFAHDRELVAYALERLAEVHGLRVMGPPADRRGGLVAFTMDGIHPHDVATVLDERRDLRARGAPLRHAAARAARRAGVGAGVVPLLFAARGSRRARRRTAPGADASSRARTTRRERPLPREHPRPPPPPAVPRHDRERRPHVRGRQSALRRPHSRWTCACATACSRGALQRPRLLDQPGGGVDAVRTRRGQDARRDQEARRARTCSTCSASTWGRCASSARCSR